MHLQVSTNIHYTEHVRKQRSCVIDAQRFILLSDKYTAHKLSFFPTPVTHGIASTSLSF